MYDDKARKLVEQDQQRLVSNGNKPTKLLSDGEYEQHVYSTLQEFEGFDHHASEPIDKTDADFFGPGEFRRLVLEKVVYDD